MRLLLSLGLPLVLLACADDPEGTTNKRPGGQTGDDTGGEGSFLPADAVRITSPTNGETVGTAFDFTYELGSDVRYYLLQVDGTEIRRVRVSEDDPGFMVLNLDYGRWDLGMVALDSDQVELSSYEITIRVASEDESWVTITSPADGADAANPVRFTVDASDDVDTVELFAEGWSMGVMDPDDLYSYEFTGTGYERQIEARAMDFEGTVLAMDAISLTVTPPNDPVDSDFNDTLNAYIDSYPLGGVNGYYWPADDGIWFGTTRDVYYMDELWSPGDPEGRCFCVGLTMEVFLRALQEIDQETGGDGSVNGIDQAEFREFVKDWFVRDLWGRGIVDAMENYGIGDEVQTWSEVRRGDILQFWRHSGSGHNAFFMDWETDGEGNIIGVQYWSTQSSTDGIDTNVEYFGSSGSRIDPNHFFVGRVRMPVDWEPW